MAYNNRTVLSAVTVEGGLLSADFIDRIINDANSIEGIEPGSYHLMGTEKINEAINRSWTRLRAIWDGFQASRSNLPESEPGTGLTRERWLMPLFGELGYGRLPATRAQNLEGKSYPISHGWQNVPIHLLGFGVKLDKRTSGVAGAATMSPHSMVQEYLNRSTQSLWGFVSNGLILRILRNNANIARQSYIEFDLEAMMEGELFSNFVVLWLIGHQSRFEAEELSECWIEKWCQTVQEEGSRVLERLRNGVEKAISTLGSGFLAYPTNDALRSSLKSGTTDKQDYYRRLLRLVYRIIFLCTAEDRELLFDEATDTRTLLRYNRHFSMRRLRNLAENRRGSDHHDLYEQFKLIMHCLGNDYDKRQLGLPALGSYLWSEPAIGLLNDARISNRDWLAAIRALTINLEGKHLARVDYRHLGAEELGSVYESLLELHPQIHIEGWIFELLSSAGNERKTTGSYYTPTSLINCLLDSALEPVLAEASKSDDPETAILNLKICDPACGSGQFLIGAARRIAYRLATIRNDENEATPEQYRTALREVISRCIYAVDINEMAVELCKLNLWLESLQPGQPLNFLDHHIKCGNSLLGVSPALLNKGIPDAAYEAIEGDRKVDVSVLKKQNKQEREGQGNLFHGGPSGEQAQLKRKMEVLDRLVEQNLAEQSCKERLYRELISSEEYKHQKLIADTWCAAFVFIKDSTQNDVSITQDVLDQVECAPGGLDRTILTSIESLSHQYQFFHWHLEFSDVFSVPDNVAQIEKPEQGWSGGFDVLLGNPPWERIKLQEKEWFASRVPEIAAAPNAAARQRMIKELERSNPVMLQAFLADRRKAEGESHYIRKSGYYPLCGRGDINTYAVFAELFKNLMGPTGRVGCIVPSGIATDDTTKFYFQEIVQTQALASLFDFENRLGIFQGVHRSYKFCLLTLTGFKRPILNATFMFFALRTEDLHDTERLISLSAGDIELLNPNTKTCPIFRSRRDAELTKAIYRRVPVLIKEGPPEENPWGISFQRMIDMSNDSGLFLTRLQLEEAGMRLEGNVFVGNGETYLPLYEAKMIHQFDHRFGSYENVASDSANTQLPTPTLEQYQDPDYVALPRYWVDEREVLARVSDVPRDLARAWATNNEKAMNETLHRWLNGYLANHKMPLPKVGLIRMLQGGNTTRAASIAMENEYPLSDIEFERINDLDYAEEACEWLIRERSPKWLLGFRDIARSTDERTAISSIIPFAAVGNNLPLMILNGYEVTSLLLQANISSFVYDYVARLKVGGTHMNFYIVRQTPVLMLAHYNLPISSVNEFIIPRVLELTNTATDFGILSKQFFNRALIHDWDENRRFIIRCELDAAYFHLYGVARDDVEHIMDTFPGVKRKDEAAFGTYRTKDTILEIYDRMKDAMAKGVPFESGLNPPPGPPLVWPIPEGEPWPEHIHREV